MKLLSKSVLSGVILSSLMGLTACQNMPMIQKHAPNPMHNDTMSHGQKDAKMFTEGEILQILSTANKGEILQAQVAMPKLQVEQARSFAESMITRHTENETKGQALGMSLGIVPRVSHASNALQIDSNNMVTKLGKSAAAVDKDYIMGQIMQHEKVLKTIDTQLMPSAKTPELRQFLAQTRSEVAMHLEMAKKISTMMS